MNSLNIHHDTPPVNTTSHKNIYGFENSEIRIIHYQNYRESPVEEHPKLLN